ncbi:putative carbon-nitrogen hydrolase [Flavobacterium enshiense DK69]|nr:putative carbon-nitrogen hydrolase [Flavobacterium enshiense DK69]
MRFSIDNVIVGLSNQQNREIMNDTVEIRELKLEDYKQLIETMEAAYTNWAGGMWTYANIDTLIQKFPEGQLVVCFNDKIVGCALSIIVNYDDFGDRHTYKDITGDYTFSTHNKEGDVLYGIEIFIHPDYRGRRLGRRLYDVRKELCEKMNLKAVVFGGRIPNYYKHVTEMKPREYIAKVKNKEIYDPVLTFQLSNDFHVKKVLTNYMPGDSQSREFATLLQWDNVYYEDIEALESKRITRNVRLGLIQWEMRYYTTLEQLFKQAEYFIDSVSGYKADFAMFPEFFNAPMMALLDSKNEADAMRQLSEYTVQIRDQFSEWAIKYNVNIITGSMPFVEDGRLQNVGFLCHRSGKIDYYEKIHITPDEEKYWGLKGGDMIQSYDTDAGKIGILICYDVEFPELARLLSEDRIQILFVPYLTDTHNAYMRVRHCAAARAIENECFVAITGSVGNLPQVEAMDLHYSQAVVFTPCDFAFPFNGIKSEATANTEMILISDVDLSLLENLHFHGSVKNLLDKRNDLYSTKFNMKSQTPPSE